MKPTWLPPAVAATLYAIPRTSFVPAAAATMSAKPKAVQVFGRKRHATAVAHCKEGKGLIRLNGQPLHLVEPAILRVKVMEPVLLLGPERFAAVDIRIRVSGGGHSSQVYAVRQALAKSLVAYTQKCEWRRHHASVRHPWAPPLPLTLPAQTWTRSPSRPSRTRCWLTIGRCWWLTRGTASPRSLVVRVLVHDSKNRTADHFSGVFWRWLAGKRHLRSVCAPAARVEALSRVQLVDPAPWPDATCGLPLAPQ